MIEPRPTPWNPDRRWADPLIALLLLLSVLTTFEALRAQQKPRPESHRPGLQSRVMELQAAGMAITGRNRPMPPPKAAAPWDRAVQAILLAETGSQAEGLRQAATTPEPFQRAWRGVYGGEELPSAKEIEALREPLGAGYAFHRFQAALAERQHQDPEPLRARARSWALPRLAFLGLGGLTLLGLSLVGIISTGLLLFKKDAIKPAGLAPCPMTWRAAALAFLGWFVALRFSGTVAALLFAFLPLPKVLALPFAYSFHVWVGVRLLLRAEGTTLRQAWKRMTPGPTPRAIGWAAAFLGIALVSVLLVGLLLQPLVRQAEPPQRELLDLIGGITNPMAMLLLFATIAGLAPLFEEWLFRGTLLPWLGHLFSERGVRGGWLLAVVFSGLMFGAMHLQPAALPGLCTLGMVLGWAFLRTGNLWTTVVMHACWNGGVFVMIRVLA
ncbi:MAG: type II CAAX endopeptidase family protein [Holophaga sp.]|nr:type II CAAX endopeptidase family protein [Holophaga sp.]